MKKFLASILRLSISYGKFAVMLFTLSLIKTGINENPNFRYLSKSSHYLKKQQGHSIHENRDTL